MKKLILALCLLSATSEAQTCTYQEACYGTVCGLCNHLGSQSFGEPVRQLGGLWCSSGTEEDGYADCSWCGPPVTECATANSPWGSHDGHSTICDLCWAGHNVGTAILCTPFHCDNPTSTYCNIVECNNYCV